MIDKEEMQRVADEPQQYGLRAPTERTIREIIAGQQVRKFCVEQAVAVCVANRDITEPVKLAEDLYRFMTAEPGSY